MNSQIVYETAIDNTLTISIGQITLFRNDFKGIFIACNAKMIREHIAMNPKII